MQQLRDFLQVFPTEECGMPLVAGLQPLRDADTAMKKPTGSLSFQSAFSLVELLVVIAVIAVIAAIAIPNIAGITQNAADAAGKRNAQNLASISSAAAAAGALPAALGANLGAAITALTNAAGITVTNGSITNGPFRVDGVPADLSKVTNHLTFDSASGVIRYTPQ
jgi:prepilin-type N-terminal cleavage/methylation domain-containing protein